MLALEQARAIIAAQETWDVNDDLCDCTYQRIGYWNNPYIGETYEIRLCCVWAEFEKQYPQFFKRTQIDPAEWDGEVDMPRSIYHRQLSKSLGIPVADARLVAEEAPKGKPKAQPVPFVLLVGGRELEIDLRKVRFH